MVEVSVEPNNKLNDTEYKKILLSGEKDNGVQSINIDKECLLQLNSENYNKVKTLLDKRIADNIAAKNKKEIDSINDNIEQIKIKFNDLNTDIEGIRENSLIKTVNPKNPENLDKSVYLDELKSNIKTLKDSIHSAKEKINKLDSSKIFNDIFTDIEKNISMIDKNKFDMSKLNNLITPDLNYITGYVFHGLLRKKKYECYIKLIDTKKKIYVVITKNGDSITINSNNVCLVSDNKNSI